MKYLISSLLLCFIVMIARAGHVDTLAIPSASMHKNVKCVVVRPNLPAAQLKNARVIYLLNGYSGNHTDFVKHMGPYLMHLADVHHWLIVCPDGNNSWYWDSPIDPAFKYETYVSKELPAYIDSHYNTMASPAGRAISGLSMGGHGALFTAIRHSDVFGAVGSMSGGVDIRPFPGNWDIAQRLGRLDTSAHNWDAYTVMNAVDNLKPGQLAIIFDCGVKDFFHDVNAALHAKLLRLGIDHDYTERPGEHNWDYWNNSLQFQMLFFEHFFDRTAAPVKKAA